MYCTDMKSIGATGSEEDLAYLLVAFGNKGTNNGGVEQSKKCIDWICDGVEEDEDLSRKIRKNSMLAAYSADKTAFVENHAVPPSALKELRDAQQQSSETIMLLVEHIGILTDEVARLAKELEKQKAPASKKAAAAPEEAPAAKESLKPFAKISGAVV